MRAAGTEDQPPSVQHCAPGVPCFTPGIRLATARGAIPVEQIAVGDLLQTADNGFQPVIWVGRRDLSAADLWSHPHLRPVLLSPGGLLANERALLVSPQHRFMLNRRRLGDLGAVGEAFLRARLLQHVAPQTACVQTADVPVSYVHLMTERHQVVFAEGVATETFWPGPEALRGLSLADQQELFDLFPELLPALRLQGAAGRQFVDLRYCSLARQDVSRGDLAALAPGGQAVAARSGAVAGPPRRGA
ncbi:Hint domain-containing protein [Epibacterium sp. MM17-32]|uniref:Hint domain-containing protein n=1 Tax=Epibacterium sp. MM17-32 TaxID=2917734 RepID=UPI001EF74397|nr:Hint domain-containing protein [Epibacterium sp. MM17-32]MCG7627752.1 Hint domain-containing protein [Epibacterium sp. MM17-32]